MQDHRNPKDTRVWITCEACGKRKLRKRYRALDPTRRQFCEPECYWANKKRIDLELRFWPKVDKSGPIPTRCPELGPCWIWTAAHSTKGYGSISKGGRGTDSIASRIAWELTFGPIPDGLQIRHKCDTPPCVNPEHLELGTAADNTRDMIERGRESHAPNPPGSIARGERHGSRTHPERVARGEAKHKKLTEVAVREILCLWETGSVQQKDLALQFGVSRMTISDICRRKTWQHVTN